MNIIRLNALADWSKLDKGKALVFDTGPETNRAVRILLNLETLTSLYLEPQSKDEEIRHLITAGPGLVRLEFDAMGVFGVFADDQAGEVQYQCTEFEAAHIEKVDDSSFTEIVTRRAVDPAFEEVMYRAGLNLERRLAAQQTEHQRQLAALIQQVKNDVGTTQPTTAPVVAPVSSSAEQSGGDPGAQAAGGGNGS